MPKTMTTLNLGHRFADARFVRVNVAFRGVHVGVSGEHVERERVHVLRPAGEAGVPESLQNERFNLRNFERRVVLLLHRGRFDVTARRIGRENPIAGR